MQLEMVLNELSYYTLADDRYAARQLMSGLIHTLTSASKLTRSKVLRTQESFFAIELAPDYKLNHWMSDSEVNRDELRYWLTIVTKAPLLRDIADPVITDSYALSEFFHDGELAYGLGVAHSLDAMAVSFSSSSRWDAEKLYLVATWLQTNEELVSENVVVIHASRPEHILHHHAWAEKRLVLELRDGQALLDSCGRFFPSVELCVSAIERIQTLRPGDPMLIPVARKLFELEEYCQAWSRGHFRPHGAREESQPTLNRFGRDRSFICPDGVRRVFTWHVSIARSHWRLHFHPRVSAEGASILVGYIGEHLPTVSNPT